MAVRADTWQYNRKRLNRFVSESDIEPPETGIARNAEATIRDRTDHE
jgi:hypothetical protein